MPDLANEKHEDTSDVQGILNGLVSRFSLQDDSLSVRDATALAPANDLPEGIRRESRMRNSSHLLPGLSNRASSWQEGAAENHRKKTIEFDDLEAVDQNKTCEHTLGTSRL